jgi:hypothetical protein
MELVLTSLELYDNDANNQLLSLVLVFKSLNQMKLYFDIEFCSCFA